MPKVIKVDNCSVCPWIAHCGVSDEVSIPDDCPLDEEVI